MRWYTTIFFGVVYLVLLTEAIAYSGYKDEFSLPNETVSFEDSWSYISNEGFYRQIEVYTYCSSKCVLVAFDVLNIANLGIDSSSDFFESFLLRDSVTSGKIKEEYYNVDYYSKSITCDYIVPQFTPELKNLATDITTGKIIPSLLPKNAQKTFLQLRNSGKELSILREANPYILVIGASCISSDAGESVCASTLNSCKELIDNLRNKRTYDGQAEDLITCHNQAISQLNLLKFSPNNVLNYVEIGASNVIKDVVNTGENTWCSAISIFGSTIAPPTNQLMIQVISIEL